MLEGGQEMMVPEGGRVVVELEGKAALAAVQVTDGSKLLALVPELAADDVAADVQAADVEAFPTRFPFPPVRFMCFAFTLTAQIIPFASSAALRSYTSS